MVPDKPFDIDDLLAAVRAAEQRLAQVSIPAPVRQTPEPESQGN
jgi:hypothetical protein